MKTLKTLINKYFWVFQKKFEAFTPSPLSLVRYESNKSSSVFIQKHISDVLIFDDKRLLWSFCLNKSDNSGLHIECGVFKADSIKYFANQKPKIQYYGFDSFEGLSEDWIGSHKPKGSFNLNGNLPLVPNNVTLIKGWIKNTLPDFLGKKNSTKISFLHIDTDTYEPAFDILTIAKDFFESGTIIIFDELIGYPGWEVNEYKALNAVLDDNDYRYIAFSNTQGAIQII